MEVSYILRRYEQTKQIHSTFKGTQDRKKDFLSLNNLKIFTDYSDTFALSGPMFSTDFLKSFDGSDQFKTSMS